MPRYVPLVPLVTAAAAAAQLKKKKTWWVTKDKSKSCLVVVWMSDRLSTPL